MNKVKKDFQRHKRDEITKVRQQNM